MFRNLIEISQLSKDDVFSLLNLANEYRIKMPRRFPDDIVVANLFYEDSTRTRVSFELAAKKLGLTVINLDIDKSSANKGETIEDTVANLEAMGISIFVIRHSKRDVIENLADTFKYVSFINAGSGAHAHPTQCLLDLLTILQFKGSFNNLSVAIVGDIKHSRVANSLLHGLKLMDVADIRLCSPKEFMPSKLPIGTYVEDINSALKDVDVIVTLRVQRERFDDSLTFSLNAYRTHYRIDDERIKLAKPNVIVMHPGPMNRGVEIASSVADGDKQCIFRQVDNGVFVRMAILSSVINFQQKLVSAT